MCCSVKGDLCYMNVLDEHYAEFVYALPCFAMTIRSFMYLRHSKGDVLSNLSNCSDVMVL